MPKPWESEYAPSPGKKPWEQSWATPKKLSIEEEASQAAGIPISGIQPPKVKMEQTPGATGLNLINEAVIRPARSIQKGYYEGVAGGAHGLSNAAKGIGKLTGTTPGGAFESIEKAYQGEAQALEGQGATGLAGMLYRGVGRAVPDIAKYTLATTALGGPAGMAAVDALSESDKGIGPAAMAGAKGAALGFLGHVMAPARPVARMAGMGTAMGADAAIAGGSPTDIIAAGLTGAGMAALGGAGTSFKNARLGEQRANIELANLRRGQAERAEAQADPVAGMGTRPIATARPVPGASPGQIARRAYDLAAADIDGSTFKDASPETQAKVQALMANKGLASQYVTQAKAELANVAGPTAERPVDIPVEAAERSALKLAPGLLMGTRPVPKTEQPVPLPWKEQLQQRYGHKTKAAQEEAYRQGYADVHPEDSTRLPWEYSWQARPDTALPATPIKSAEESAAVFQAPRSAQDAASTLRKPFSQRPVVPETGYEQERGPSVAPPQVEAPQPQRPMPGQPLPKSAQESAAVFQQAAETGRPRPGMPMDVRPAPARPNVKSAAKSAAVFERPKSARESAEVFESQQQPVSVEDIAPLAQKTPTVVKSNLTGSEYEVPSNSAGWRLRIEHAERLMRPSPDPLQERQRRVALAELASSGGSGRNMAAADLVNQFLDVEAENGTVADVQGMPARFDAFVQNARPDTGVQFSPDNPEFKPLRPSGGAQSEGQVVESARSLLRESLTPTPAEPEVLKFRKSQPDSAPAQGSKEVIQSAPMPGADQAAPAPVGQRTIPDPREMRIPIEDLHVDPQRFQYKMDAYLKGGVTDEYKGVTKYDRDKAGTIAVWRDPADGKTYVVNGHHRYEMASRLGEDSMAVRYIDAANAAEARLKGALINIGDGKGTAIDAAKVFRDSGLTPEELAQAGISLKGKVAEDGMALSKLTGVLFDDVVRGGLTHRQGAIIGRGNLSESAQIAVAKFMASHPNMREGALEEVVRRAGKSGTKTVEQESLFGTNEYEENLFNEEAHLVADIKARLGQEKRLFGAVGNESAAARLAGAGNKIEAERNAQIAGEAGEALGAFDALQDKSGPIADAISQAAREVADGKPRKAAADRLYEVVRAEVSKALRREEGGLFAEPGGGTPGSEAASPGLFDRVAAKLDQVASDAASRIDQRGTFKGGTLLAGVPPVEDMRDVAMYGAAKIGRGVVDFAKWSSEMTREIGQAVKPFLEGIWRDANKIHQRMMQSVVGDLPSTKRLMRMYKKGGDYAKWYNESEKELTEIFGEDAPLFIRLLAATSPGSTVSSNLSLALRSYAAYKTGGEFPGMMGSVRKLVDLAIAGEPFPETAPKVTNFSAALTGKVDAVTVDRWIARALGFGDKPTKQQYAYMDHMISQIARQRGIDPREMQAALWKAAKDEAGSASDSRPFEQVLRSKLEQDPELKAAMEQALSVTPAQPRVSPRRMADQGGFLNIPGKRPPAPLDPADAAAQAWDAKREAARKGPEKTIRDRVNQFRKDFATGLTPILDAIDASVKAGAKIAWKDNWNNAAARSVKAREAAEMFIRDKGLQDVLRAPDDYNMFNNFLIAQEVLREARAEGRTTGVDLAEANAIYTKYVNRPVNEAGLTYGSLSKQFSNYANDLLNYSVDAGLVSQQLAQQWRKQYGAFVPLARVHAALEEGGAHIGNKSVASLTKQTVYQKRVGSEAAIEYPVETMLERTRAAFMQGEKNKAAALLASYEKLPGMDKFMREVPDWEIKKNGMPEHTFSYLRDGKRVVVETTPEWQAALKGLHKETLGTLAKLLAGPVRVVKFGTTGINLAFAAVNPFRDWGTILVNSKEWKDTALNPKVFWDATKAALLHDENWSRIEGAGAGFTSLDLFRDTMAKTAEHLRATRSGKDLARFAFKHPITTAGSLFRALEDIAQRTEQMDRARLVLGTERANLRRGMDPENALAAGVYAANNELPAYHMSGNAIAGLKGAVLYLNARIQGIRSFASAMQERPASTMSKLIVGLYTPAALLTIANMSTPLGKEVSNDMEEYEKEGNLFWVSPWAKKNPKTGRWDGVMKFPLSPDLGSLVTPLRRIIEQEMGGRKVDPLKDVARPLAGSVLPFDPTPRGAIVGLSPHVVKAPYEYLANYDVFRDKPTVPQGMQDLPVEEQYRPNTSGTVRKVAGALDASPLKVEQFVKNVVGGVTPQILNTVDWVASKVGAIPESEVGGDTLPAAVTRRFYSASGGAQENSYYTLRRGAQERLSRYFINQMKSTPGFDKFSDKEQQRAIKNAAARARAAVQKMEGRGALRDAPAPMKVRIMEGILKEIPE